MSTYGTLFCTNKKSGKSDPVYERNTRCASLLHQPTMYLSKEASIGMKGRYNWVIFTPCMSKNALVEAASGNTHWSFNLFSLGIFHGGKAGGCKMRAMESHIHKDLTWGSSNSSYQSNVFQVTLSNERDWMFPKVWNNGSTSSGLTDSNILLRDGEVKNSKVVTWVDCACNAAIIGWQPM